MGAPLKAQAELWTDAIAAIVQKDLDGFGNEYYGKTVSTLWDLVDSSGDPYVENALGLPAVGVDAMSRPENVATYLADVCNRAALKSFAAALSSLVMSDTGGGYDTFRAYLVAVGAKLHPLFAEVARRALSSEIFTAAGVVAGVSNPAYAAIFADRVYRGADAALTDATDAASSATAADVPLFATNGHALYIGCDRKFQAIVVALSTVSSSTVTPTFQYWTGSTWATLTVTDNSAGLTRNDTITWVPPTDWSPGYQDASPAALGDKARLYYIRIARTAAAVTTPPVASVITLVPTVIPSSPGGLAHAAIPQPPLALARITGVNTIAVTLPASIDVTRWAGPVGSENKLRLRALTQIASNVTPTLDYTKADGTDASNVQAAWTAPAVLGTFTLVLAGSNADTLKAVRITTSAVTAAVAGVFAVECQEIRLPVI